MNNDNEGMLGEVVRLVRDQAIRDAEINARVDNVVSRRWRAALESAELSNAIQAIAPDVVDMVIFYLLESLAAGELNLTGEIPADVAAQYLAEVDLRSRLSTRTVHSFV